MDTDELHLNATFPLKASIWPGALLASIGHAIFVARAPFMTHEQSWDGLNYSVQDSEGSRGTISFDESKINFVAVFYLQTSRRNPLNRDVTNANDSTVYVRDVPDQLKKLTHEALQYVIPDVAGEAQPVITAAFWSDPSGSQVTASEPWRDVVEHGAVLVEN